MHGEIDAADLLNRLSKGEKLNLLDVREEIEYCTYNIGGENMPLHSILENEGEIGPNKNEEIIVVCSAGLRSATAAASLTEKGYTNVKNLTGGLLALRKLKY
jgi:rhodanese-related sulfurtransferase